MYRTFVLALAIVLMSGLGCGGNKPAATPSEEPAAKPDGESPVAPPAKAVAAPTAPAAAPATKTPPSAATRFRELASGYLENDNKGGWRKNEKVATELEKLTAEEVAQMWPLLKDADVNVRRGTAVFLLGLFDSSVGEQVQAFTGLLNDSDAMVRSRGLDAAKQFAAAGQIAALEKLASLLDAKREERADNRVAVARLCGALKRDAASAGAALKQAAASDPDAKVRSAALVALAQIVEPAEVVETLAGSLRDDDPSVRLVAAARLRQLGPAAALAAEPLAAALADASPAVSEAAAETLIRIGPAAVTPLAAQLAATSAPTRKLALACLIKLGPAAKSALGQIEKCKNDADPEVKKLAAAAVARLTGK